MGRAGATQQTGTVLPLIEAVPVWEERARGHPWTEMSGLRHHGMLCRGTAGGVRKAGMSGVSQVGLLCQGDFEILLLWGSAARRAQLPPMRVPPCTERKDVRSWGCSPALSRTRRMASLGGAARTRERIPVRLVPVRKARAKAKVKNQ